MKNEHKKDSNEDLKVFQNELGVAFNDLGMLGQALTHRSFVNEHHNPTLENNERLEFLGDAVLELAASNYLYHQYPDVAEGYLTAYRSGLVNTSTLSETASELGANEHLRLSKGEARDVGRARQYILADTFEAITGAIYLDQGYEAAETFLKTKLFPKVDRIVKKRLWQDAKSLFQEKAQEFYSTTPSYDVLEESGPDHDKTFTAGVFIGGELVARADGPSKQDAEQSAAERGLEEKSWR